MSRVRPLRSGCRQSVVAGRRHPVEEGSDVAFGDLRLRIAAETLHPYNDSSSGNNYPREDRVILPDKGQRPSGGDVFRRG